MSDNNDSMKIHSNTSISMWNTLFVFRSTFILLFILLGMLTKSHAFQTIVTLQIYKQKISSTTSISARFIESGVDELMKFGNTMNIKLKLPCRDQDVATKFISDEDSLLDALWEAGKYKKLGGNKYLLVMNSIGVPGFGFITPEIEILLLYKAGVVSLQSSDWTLRGDSDKVLKDSKFMKSFDIKLSGILSIAPCPSAPSDKPVVEAVGKVQYHVEGMKPSIFKAAPPFVLTSLIDLIQEGVIDYTETQFTSRFLKAFRAHLISAMQSKPQ